MSEITWDENTACARCGTSLDGGYESNHLGVRFCNGCFEDGIREKMAERIARPVELTESCSRCDGSLINGCRENYIGVLYCTVCFEWAHGPDGYPLTEHSETHRDTNTEPVAPILSRRKTEDIDDTDISAGWGDSDEDEAIYLHDVFLVTTLFALVLYAIARLSGSLFSLSGF